eukprot:CAMPEP_0197056394 /NCGR_PEP_ID=MMETSP1384-20130603/83954_1 /TAXON_ID=29189 /ORGANISM="Ammonia sp." /LENGTH=146 /DNA_ID=CAMNT_0042490357 /DNA_START=30 /DNA_END=470 /DNA_ORIENTATION=+
MSILVKVVLLLSLICYYSASAEDKYEERGPCKYCKYCAFCDECRHCPCTSKGPDDLPYCEYCSYCQYCTYCKLCDYCEEGGALSRLTQSVANIADTVLNLFQPSDRDLAKKAQDDFSKGGDVDKDEKLKEEKLEEIERKYKDKMDL